MVRTLPFRGKNASSNLVRDIFILFIYYLKRLHYAPKYKVVYVTRKNIRKTTKPLYFFKNNKWKFLKYKKYFLLTSKKHFIGARSLRNQRIVAPTFTRSFAISQGVLGKVKKRFNQLSQTGQFSKKKERKRFGQFINFEIKNTYGLLNKKSKDYDSAFILKPSVSLHNTNILKAHEYFSKNTYKKKVPFYVVKKDLEALKTRIKTQKLNVKPLTRSEQLLYDFYKKSHNLENVNSFHKMLSLQRRLVDKVGPLMPRHLENVSGFLSYFNLLLKQNNQIQPKLKKDRYRSGIRLAVFPRKKQKNSRFRNYYLPLWRTWNVRFAMRRPKSVRSLKNKLKNQLTQRDWRKKIRISSKRRRGRGHFRFDANFNTKSYIRHKFWLNNNRQESRSYQKMVYQPTKQSFLGGSSANLINFPGNLPFTSFISEKKRLRLKGQNFEERKALRNVFFDLKRKKRAGTRMRIQMMVAYMKKFISVPALKAIQGSFVTMEDNKNFFQRSPQKTIKSFFTQLRDFLSFGGLTLKQLKKEQSLYRSQGYFKGKLGKNSKFFGGKRVLFLPFLSKNKIVRRIGRNIMKKTFLGLDSNSKNKTRSRRQRKYHQASNSRILRKQQFISELRVSTYLKGLLGRSTLKSILFFYRKLMKKRSLYKTYTFMNYLTNRLDIALQNIFYITKGIFYARQSIQNKRFLLNKNMVFAPSQLLKLGDVISIKSSHWGQDYLTFFSNFLRYPRLLKKVYLKSNYIIDFSNLEFMVKDLNDSSLNKYKYRRLVEIHRRFK